MAVLEPYAGDYYLWHYLPSVPAAVIFTLIFLSCTLGLSWRSWKGRVKFSIPFVIGTFFEVIGYAARAAAHNNTSSIIPYSVQSSFTLLGPTLMAATIYMMFGRLARAMRAETHSIVRVNLLTKLFVSGDVLAFVVQAGAAGLLVIQSMAASGKAMVVLGLVIQILSFGLFMVTSVVFHKRVVNDFTLKSSVVGLPWERLMRLMYVVGVLILARSVFRLVEYVQGTEGYSMTHEWTLYVFDGVPMAFSAGLVLVCFPDGLQQAVSVGMPSYTLGTRT